MMFVGYSKLIRNSQTWVDISGPLCQKKMWRKEVQENLIFLFSKDKSVKTLSDTD